jgi:hypothetical protein
MTQGCHCERVYERVGELVEPSNLALSVTAEMLIHTNLDNTTRDCFATLVQNFSAYATKFFSRFARNDK